MSNGIENQLQRLADSIASLREDVDTRLTSLENKFNSLENKVENSDIKIEAYQKASNQVVNLAFGLIVASSLSILTAALTIVIPFAIKVVSNQ